MISISRLLCDTISPGDGLRYGESKGHPSGIKPAPGIPRPVVVWNFTRQCNLSCLHCYASANNCRSPEEMDTDAGKALLHDLAEFKVPVILFSGGEPLLRKDLFELAALARELGIRVALSTNGTLINRSVAEQISEIGFAEAGISLDGIGLNNDRFRGRKGAYQAALDGIRNCVALGVKVSLRLTITRFNYQEIPAIFRLIEEEGVNRVCFYHLAYAGRGGSLRAEDVDHAQTRAVVDEICDRTLDLHRRGFQKEILTVSNHADGVYLYLKLREQDPERASTVLEMLRTNGGNNSGIKIGAVDDLGNVHPDQFWWHYSLGNVRQRKFADIWTDTAEPLLQGLKDRRSLLKGRCARCQYLDLCNGNLRVRAEAVFDDVWAEDPACYLTDEEIGLLA
ncbi:MAG: radical SAM protein [Dehalococcoidales bacterium]|nr:radical SAM protein [Dehalococcoidales bacterium]